MNEETANGTPEKSLFERIGRVFSQMPRNSEDVADMLRSAENESIIDASVLQIMEGALKVSDQQAREIMIPRSQMVIIDDDFTLEQVLEVVISSQHSRFPVVGESSDDIKGILLAKEMLPLLLSGNDSFDLKVSTATRHHYSREQTPQCAAARVSRTALSHGHSGGRIRRCLRAADH